ncbi:hypothetical protein GI584_05520 [Gracilibacillus salitolerans]|uniref:Uncharacterized protein n=1 Tax=Gracilibacillus salitolerans TaxID=2663022 RepID=A0A5Q2TJG5_9BACI|nr:hypothetical protein [Gracilibacillus salitolerans]QGH33508.1 hypothetical protein GI584_05520 [Gracilibacillus salitolerans]
MDNIIHGLRAALFVIVFIFFQIELFFPSLLVEMVLNVLSILLFLTAIIRISKFNFGLSSMFILLTIIICISQDIRWSEVIEGFSNMNRLVLFIGLIPLISMPIHDKVPHIQRIIRMVKVKINSVIICISTTFVLANFINLASLPISNSIFCTDDIKKEEQFSFAVLIVRSFGLAMLCTPIGAAVAVAIDMTNASLIYVLLINLLITLIGLYISYRLERPSNTESADLEKQASFNLTDTKFMVYLFVPFVLYFAILFISNSRFSIGMMESIIVSILPVTLIWSLAIRKVKKWWKFLKNQIVRKVPHLFDQFSVIISAGVVIYVLELVELNHMLISLLQGGESPNSGVFYIPATILFILLLSVMGVHQFVTVVFIGELIDPVALGISPTVFACVLLVGFVSAMIASSFSGANILANSLLPFKSSHDFAKRSYRFTILFVIIASIILVIINYFIRGF